MPFRQRLQQAVELGRVRIRSRLGTTFGSSVSRHGLWRITRSRRARLKTLCSITWYFPTERGDRPDATAWVTQAWTVDGRMACMGMSPKNGRKCRSR